MRMIFLTEACSLLKISHIIDGASARILPPTTCPLKIATSNMSPHKPRKTNNSAKHDPPETPPQPDPQDHCLLFKLPLELREMIYTYVFAPGPECSSDSDVAVAALGDRYYKVSPSGALLQSCRLLNTDAADVFAQATRNLTLVIDPSSARRRRSNVSPVPKLDDAQMSRIKRLVVIKNGHTYNRESLEFVERLLPCGTAYWAQVGADPARFAYDVNSASSPMTNIRSLALSRARYPGVLKKKQFGRILSQARAYRTGVPKD